MTLEQLADKWEAEAAELLRTSKAYRSTCNAALKSAYVGRAKTLLACAQAIREVASSERN